MRTRTGVLIGDRKGVLIGDRTGNFGVIIAPYRTQDSYIQGTWDYGQWLNAGTGYTPAEYGESGGSWDNSNNYPSGYEYEYGGGGGFINDNPVVIPVNQNNTMLNGTANNVNCACLTGTPHIVDGNCTCENNMANNGNQLPVMIGTQPSLLDWAKANPLPSLAIVGGILWFLTRK